MESVSQSKEFEKSPLKMSGNFKLPAIDGNFKLPKIDSKYKLPPLDANVRS